MNQLALFDMPTPRGPTEPIVRTADIEGIYRWTLTRAWGAGPCILWCGTNPSTADAVKDDPTVLREMRFSWLWGFGSMIKVNVYPLRSPSMKELGEWLKTRDADESAREAWIRNCNEIADVVKDCDFHMAAWGNGVDPHDLELLLEHADSALLPDDIAPFADPNFQPPTLQWHCLGRTGSGAPIHPLARGHHRVPDTARPVLWREAA